MGDGWIVLQAYNMLVEITRFDQSNPIITFAYYKGGRAEVRQGW